MKIWTIIFRVIILIISAIVIAFNVLLYRFCEQQKMDLNMISEQQKVDAQVNSNKFKYQQDQIERIGKDLEDAQEQIKDQKLTLADQKDESKNIQTSLVDIKAESDAIKENMQGWQKDYVSVLAQLEKKIDDSQVETKSLEDNLTALNIPALKADIQSIKSDIEKMAHPQDNSVSTSPAPDNQVQQPEVNSQL